MVFRFSIFQEGYHILIIVGESCWTVICIFLIACEVLGIIFQSISIDILVLVPETSVHRDTGTVIGTKDASFYVSVGCV